MEENKTPIEETTAVEENTPVEENGKKGKKNKPKKSIGREILEWIGSFAAAIVIVLIIHNFLFTLIKVDGLSMYPTLDDGERLFVTVTDVKFGSEIPRDSIVICKYPNRTSKYFGLIDAPTYFVKRLVAVPGDTLIRENFITYVQYAGSEERIALDQGTVSMYQRGEDYTYTLGEDEYFAVGDNRENSHDSRDWNDGNASSDVGPITKDMVVGRVRCVFWPFNAIRLAK